MVVAFPGDFAGFGVNLLFDVRTIELREKLVLLPDRERLLPVGGLRELPGLGSLDVAPELVFRRDVLLLSAAAFEFRLGSRLVEVAERVGILVGEVRGVRTRSLSLVVVDNVPKLSS